MWPWTFQQGACSHSRKEWTNCRSRSCSPSIMGFSRTDFKGSKDYMYNSRGWLCTRAAIPEGERCTANLCVWIQDLNTQSEGGDWRYRGSTAADQKGRESKRTTIPSRQNECRTLIPMENWEPHHCYSWQVTGKLPRRTPWDVKRCKDVKQPWLCEAQLIKIVPFVFCTSRWWREKNGKWLGS